MALGDCWNIVLCLYLIGYNDSSFIRLGGNLSNQMYSGFGRRDHRQSFKVTRRPAKCGTPQMRIVKPPLSVAGGLVVETDVRAGFGGTDSFAGFYC